MIFIGMKHQSIRHVIREAVKEEFASLRVRDLVSSVPAELQELYDICQNEIKLGGNDLNIIYFYSLIYTYVLMYHFGLTNKHVPMDMVKDMLTKSNNELETKRQYKTITKPTHLLPAMMLKMVVDAKKFKLGNLQMDGLATLTNLIKYKFTGNIHYSKSLLEQILRSKIIPD